MTRITFEQIYMNLAENLAKRSTCKRLSVGCVITSSDYQRVLSVGYNGNAKGFPNKCDSNEPGKCGCIHAEENALIKCSDIKEKKVIFITTSPCKMCSKKLINLGNIKKVFYRNDYRLNEGIDILKKAKIKVKKIIK